MALEINDNAAYLRALKGADESALPDNGIEPKALPCLEDSSQKPSPVEKRRAPRYKCEGSAQIREDGAAVHTWATFTDVSVHGCYVEAQATYPVGAVLHLRLECNGIRVESKGNVRVSYPYLGMGIAFVDLNDENQVRLRQLLAKISHPCVIMGPGIASSLPATSSLQSVPVITNPAAAVQELIDFFESRQMLMRDDFLRLLKKSQSK
jgi:hypothetical protein